VTRYRCVDARKAEGFTVTKACQAAGVSTSAYYQWAARGEQPPSDREVEQQRLRAEIRASHKRAPRHLRGAAHDPPAAA
jgi:putative transposase